jgi:hypothetical protein
MIPYLPCRSFRRPTSSLKSLLVPFIPLNTSSISSTGKLLPSISSTVARGTNCPYYAVVATYCTRLDQYGCLEPGGFEHTEQVNTGCTAVDFKTGKRKTGPVKEDLNLCEDIPVLSDCLVEEMTEIALKLGKRIGVAMRIDVFVENDTIYVQEYYANHMNGIRYCAAKMDNGCIDSCFLGRTRDAAGGPYGGELTAVPDQIKDYADLSTQQQCELLMGAPPPTVVRSTCGIRAADAPVRVTDAPVPTDAPVRATDALVPTEARVRATNAPVPTEARVRATDAPVPTEGGGRGGGFGSA